MVWYFQLRLGKTRTLQKLGLDLLANSYRVTRNAPVILAVRSILSPLAAGNTVILKSSELSPRTHFLLVSLFVEAGFPPGVVNVIGHTRQDSSEITEALISRREVRKINFTGSSMVGRKIAAKAGEHLKPVLLELGGKSPFIVLEDADIEKAAEAAAIGSFLHVSTPETAMAVILNN